MNAPRTGTAPTEPPFLVLRPGLSFWVETGTPHDCTATLQSFREGCYSGTRWYDTTGGQWTVQEARLKKSPSLLDRLLPWRRIPVELHFGGRAEVDLSQVLVAVGEVLQSESEFCDDLKMPAAELWAEIERARTTADLIRIAGGV